MPNKAKVIKKRKKPKKVQTPVKKPKKKIAKKKAIAKKPFVKKPLVKKPFVKKPNRNIPKTGGAGHIFRTAKKKTRSKTA